MSILIIGILTHWHTSNGDAHWRAHWQVALSIKPASFAPNELIIKPGDPALSMYTIKRGLAASPGAVVGTGKHFGDDFLLSSYYRRYTVRALTFLDCFTLDRDALLSLFQYGQYPIFQVRREHLQHHDDFACF